MRLALLFLRSRNTGNAALGLIAVAIVAGSGSNLLLSVTQPADGQTAMSLLIASTVLAASVISASTASPFGEAERASSASLPMLRAIHLVLLVGLAALTMGLTAPQLDLPDVGVVVLRNLAGFVGLALVSAWLLGGRLSWIPPLGFAVTSLVQGVRSNGEIASWAWAIQPGANDPAILTAVALLFAGGALAIWFGPRPNPRSAE